jgi:hypothetical protein
MDGCMLYSSSALFFTFLSLYNDSLMYYVVGFGGCGLL